MFIMLDLETVLVPTDLSEESLSVLPYAWELARAHGAEIVLAHACSKRRLVGARRTMEELAATLDPFPHRAVVEAANPVDFLVRLTEALDRGLVIMATHGRTGLSRHLMGSTAGAVVARAACPVLTVKQPARSFLEEIPETEEAIELPKPTGPDQWKKPQTEEDRYWAEQDRLLLVEAKRKAREREEVLHGKQRHQVQLDTILVPMDFTDAAVDALMYARAFARAYGVRLLLLNVLESSRSPENGKRRRQAMEEMLEHLGATLEPVEWSVRVVEGSPAEAIVAVGAEDEVDLVVLGTRGCRSVAGIPLGSTARAVVREATCPVLTVRHRRTGAEETLQAAATALGGP